HGLELVPVGIAGRVGRDRVADGRGPLAERLDRAVAHGELDDVGVAAAEELPAAVGGRRPRLGPGQAGLGHADADAHPAPGVVLGAHRQAADPFAERQRVAGAVLRVLDLVLGAVGVVALVLPQVAAGAVGQRVGGGVLAAGARDADVVGDAQRLRGD